VTLNNLPEQSAGFALFDKNYNTKIVTALETVNVINFMEIGSAEFEIFALVGCYSA
jgi:hypothetical protein